MKNCFDGKKSNRFDMAGLNAKHGRRLNGDMCNSLCLNEFRLLKDFVVGRRKCFSICP